MKAIFIIALIVFAVAVAIYFIRLGMDKRKLEREARVRHQERVRQAMIYGYDDDETKTALDRLVQ